MHPLAKPVTAALRAGYAWSVRRERPEAWREMARMTGVIMHHLGPGRGPTTPVELAARLRKPLGEWMPVDDPDLAGLVILDADDRLTPDTYDIGCDYTVELLDPAASAWLPRWRTHRAEQVENAAFQRLVSGDDETYAIGRRFLVEHPAGDGNEILRLLNELGIPRLVEYREIGVDRQWRGWWWGCPVCRWPMSVSASGVVSCRFRPHGAVYSLLPGRRPRLQPQPEAPAAGPARPAEGAVCVDESIWRHIVVPGVVEVRLRDRLAKLPGVTADLYPLKDTYDIAVRRTGEATWSYTLDVKDYASPAALAAKLRERPVEAEYIVVPDYRSPRLTELKRLLPGMEIVTESGIYRQIKRDLT
jgi:hypothetical protein